MNRKTGLIQATLVQYQGEIRESLCMFTLHKLLTVILTGSTSHPPSCIVMSLEMPMYLDSQGRFEKGLITIIRFQRRFVTFKSTPEQ